MNQEAVHRLVLETTVIGASDRDPVLLERFSKIAVTLGDAIVAGVKDAQVAAERQWIVGALLHSIGMEHPEQLAGLMPFFDLICGDS